MPVYFDASALAPLILKEPATAWARAIILSEPRDHLISDFAIAEVTSAMAKQVRMRAVTAEAAEQLLTGFEQWVSSDTSPVTTTSADVVDAGRLVRRFELGLRTPDALHLVLARRCGAVLATLDRQMMKAAVPLGISLAPLSV